MTAEPHRLPLREDPVERDDAPHPGSLVFSCEDCEMQHSSACDDCLVSFILNRDPGDAVVIDADEARAMRMLTRVGLVPGPKHVRRVV